MWTLRVLGSYRFDLDAPEQLADADDEVVTLAFSPGLGNSVSTIGDFAHKGKLSEFAAMFIVQSFVRRFGVQTFFRDAQDSTP
jgi:hypothetical protein